MDRELYYELEYNGYHIYDRNDPYFHIHQYGDYIPNPSKSYEENAENQITEILSYSDELEINEEDTTTEEVE